MRKVIALVAAVVVVLAARPASADGEGWVDNDGQALLVHFAQPVAIYYGEAAGTTSEALHPENYTLDGVPLGEASVGCLETHFEVYTWCDTARLLLSDHTLVDGQRYQVTFRDQDLGVFTAHGLADATPPIVLGIDVTQRAIIVRFNKPMRHDGGCPGWSGATPGAVGFVGGDRPTFSSPDDMLEEAIRTPRLSAFMTADCTAVTLTVGTVFPEGRFTLDVANIEDTTGNVMVPARFAIEIPDLGAPTLQRSYGALEAGVWRVDLRFDQPLDPDTALDPASYTIDGAPLPADAAITCTEVCANVHLELARSGIDGAIQFHELTYEGIRDPAGNAPDPLESAFFPPY